MKTKEYIKKFIDFYTDYNVKNRGEKLLKSDAVQFIDYDEDSDTYNFKVQGTKKYDVVISRLEKRDLTTYCTCPYDWGTICKHTVASLLYIADNPDIKKKIEIPEEEEENIKKPFEQRAANEVVVIKDYKNLNLDIVKANTGKTTYNGLNSSRLSIKEIEVYENKVIFHLVKLSFSYHTNDLNYTATFIVKDDGLYINSNDNSRVAKNKLKQVEAFCLVSLINAQKQDLFNKLSNEKVTEIKELITADYGLSAQEFDDFFTIKFDLKDDFQIYKKDNSLELVDITEDEDNFFSKLIKEISDDTQFTKLKKTKKDLRLGFLLNKDNDYGYRYYSYVPIKGKPNKDGSKLTAKISIYDKDYDNNGVLISDEQQYILSLINDFNTSRNAEKFSLSKQIFSLLLNQKYVYSYYSSVNYRFRKKSISEISLSPDSARVILEVYNDGKFIGVIPKILIGKKTLNIVDVINEDKSGDNIVYYRKKLYHFASYKDVFLKTKFFKGAKMVNTYKKDFFDKIIQPLSKDFEIRFGENTFENEKVELDFKSRQIYISEKDDFIILQPQVVYDNNISVLLSAQANNLQIDNETGKITEYIRNFELENDFLDTVADMHPDFEKQKANKFFHLTFDEFTENMWFYKFFDKLNEQNIEIYGLKNLKKFKYSPYKGKISTSIESGQDWFDIEVKVSFGDNMVSLADVRKAVLNKEKYIQLNDGSVGILPDEWLHKLEKYFRNGTVKKDKLEISKLRFSIIDELFDNIDQTEILEEIAEKRKRLSEFTKIEKTKIPKEITADLRHYQKEGVNWLNFLNDMKWGGILADDMGLGKTLQILTFIQQIIKKDKTPNLIVVPTTLLFNWKAEIEKFAPKIKAYYHYGTDRNKDTKEFKKHHIIFTSYGILLRDIEILKEFEFNYLILDESQAIKNPASRRFKAANLIKAKNKIALTGTPIENSTFDLYAQMSFVNPGFFGSIKNFKETYSNPIDKEGNELIANELQKIIKPFVLRRTKENVATELPPKTEDIIYCEMEPEQRKIYDAYRNEYRNKILENIEKEGLAKSKMKVLEALTRLRQICDSPALIKNEDFDNHSVKIKEILAHITEKTANHKVLIFSQFVGMLSLLKEELDRLNIPYEYLDGQSSSTQRENSVNNFQNNKNLRVFLISLKAGGTGLNLTASDYVYLLDPWWNPAVENQAIDRCYRIGQDKKVFAYRMICKNTVEEKILDLQNKKKKIAGDIIQTDENIMKKLSINDLESLFS